MTIVRAYLIKNYKGMIPNELKAAVSSDLAD
jgi:hypothetical protein